MNTSDDAASETISFDEVGLPAHVRPPFRFTPARRWTPVVVSLPHVGLAWPHDLRPKPQVDLARNSDYAVERLYGFAPDMGVATLEAVYSRLVVDLNRAADDVSLAIVPDHPLPRPRSLPGYEPGAFPTQPLRARPPMRTRGVIWDTAVGNIRILHEPLRYATFQRRLERYYQPYHHALTILLERRRERFGYAILLDAHSMPSTVGIDLVLGTLEGGSCSTAIQAAALSALEMRGTRASGNDPGHVCELSLRLNDPYRGGELVRKFGRPELGLHALQLEVNRGLYLDEHRWKLREIGSAGTSGALASTCVRIQALLAALAEPRAGNEHDAAVS